MGTRRRRCRRAAPARTRGAGRARARDARRSRARVRRRAAGGIQDHVAAGRARRQRRRRGSRRTQERDDRLELTVSRIYLSPPDLAGTELELLRDAVESNWIAPLGPHVDAFEAEMCARIDMPHAVALSS